MRRPLHPVHRRCVAGSIGAAAASLAFGCAGADGVSGSSLGTGLGSASQTETAAESGGASTSDGTHGSSDAEATGSVDTGSSGDAETGPCEPTTWYLDGDDDGRGDPTMTVSACEPPPGYVPFGDDCDDTDPARHGGADEVCDGVDNDCDDVTDEAAPNNPACNDCTMLAVGDRSYAFCPGGATWDAAREHCTASGSDLLRIDDEAENTAVAQLAEPPSGVGGGWFIGLSDAASRGAFTWVDGGPLSFTAWLPGEPNDGGGDEDCAEMDLAGGGWNDVPCSMVRAFVCESGGA
ncbi:MAG: hypothetical protein JNK45_22535 [Myxococcales bacterium]|nr:hypothetical protein [Myxococcales bacterium]